MAPLLSSHAGSCAVTYECMCPDAAQWTSIVKDRAMHGFQAVIHVFKQQFGSA